MSRSFEWWSDMSINNKNALLDKYDLDWIVNPQIIEGMFVMECDHDFGRSYGSIVVCRNCGISYKHNQQRGPSYESFRGIDRMG